MTLESLWRLFQGPGDTDVPGLGELERRVMEVVWSGGEMSVRSVQDAFAGALAYTTIMTTMDRLFRKGLLDRRRQGKAFVYAPRVSHAELREGVTRGLLGRLLGTTDRESARPILSSIVDSVSERDLAMLDDLEWLVRAKRRALVQRERR